MAQANYKVTVTEHDYWYTRYTTWVSASSRNQAIAKGAALAGQAKMRREYERMSRVARQTAILHPEGLLEPEVKLETADFDEYWSKQDTVEVSE